MNNAEIPASATGNNGAVVTLNLEEIPTRTKFGDGGEVVEVKAFLDNTTIKSVPFIPSDDFGSLAEALEDAGGTGHTVSFKWRSAGTYKLLGQYGHDGEPTGSKVKYPAPCLFGDWEVKVRGITAATWTSQKTGDTGVKFTFVGLRPNRVSDGEESIPLDALPVIDRSDSED